VLFFKVRHRRKPATQNTPFEQPPAQPPVAPTL
jgi:hypothetical protein